MSGESRSERTRKALLSAAQEFLADGNQRPTIPEIAKQAGVALGTLYNYFSDRDELIAAAALDARLSSGWDEYIGSMLAFGDDLIMGTLAGAYEFIAHTDSRTARIIITAGPRYFVALRQYFLTNEGPWAGLPTSFPETGSNPDVALEIVLSGLNQILSHALEAPNRNEFSRLAITRMARMFELDGADIAPIFTEPWRLQP